MSLILDSESPTLAIELKKRASPARSAAAPAQVLEAFVILADDPHLCRWCNRLTIRLEDDSLVIDGELPSFYLKQVLQERLRCVKLRIINRTKVTS